jgi:hypothetical protein
MFRFNRRPAGAELLICAVATNIAAALRLWSLLQTKRLGEAAMFVEITNVIGLSPSGRQLFSICISIVAPLGLYMLVCAVATNIVAALRL